MKTKSLTVSAIIAALYIAVSILIAPISFTNVQFRISEMFNHLVVFNKKYMIGIVIGVFITNLFFSPYGTYDLVFGVGQSILALGLTIFSARFIKGQLTRMIFNTVVFTFTMFIIAIEIHLLSKLPFLLTWLFCAAGEFAVMAVSIPLMTALNKRINFKKLIED
ncbi:QueT transporter family protein [Rummeliibacillus sp. NPDC094406]|uniref:QueT transporter family protein n=1 Tax=Rummeliibacillus sp. NPDC094406 TaxID=3364511 RepID=UPI00380397F2